MSIEQIDEQEMDFTGEEEEPRNNKKTVALVFGSIIGLLLIAGAGWALGNILINNDTSAEEPVSVEPTGESIGADIPVDARVASYLTGVMLDREIATRRPLVVQIDNHVGARPHGGLTQADIVYEMYVEAGITRYMAVFQSQEPQLVGPVRSTRIYYLDIAREYDPYYIHEGGDPSALALIRPYGIIDLQRANSVRRTDLGYTSVHSLFFDASELYDQLRDRDDYQLETIESWQFEDEPGVSERGDITSVSIDYGSSSFNVDWEYDIEDNTYARMIGGVPEVETIGGEQVKVKNLVVFYVSYWHRSGDDKGRIDMKVVGEGDAVVFRNGQMFSAKWENESREVRTRITDLQGEDMALTPGPIWICLVPPLEGRVDYESAAVDAATAAEVEQSI